jgi:hypothetical protein
MGCSGLNGIPGEGLIKRFIKSGKKKPFFKD